MNPSDGSCVYIVHAIGTPFYKIGMTTSIKSRLASFHSTAPFIEFDPALIYYHEERAEIETQLHRRFQEQRIEGTEWFKLEEINFQHLEQDIDVIANELDRKKRTNEVYPVTNQKKPKKKKKEPPEQKERKNKPKNKTIIVGQRWEDGVPVNELYAENTIEEEFLYGLLPQIKWLYEDRGTWKAVAEYYDVDPVAIWKMANWNWMPMFDNTLRKKLGLSTFLSPDYERISDEQIAQMIEEEDTLRTQDGTFAKNEG